MKYVILTGNNIGDDISIISENIKKEDIVFIYSGKGALYDYIEALYNKGNGIDTDELYRFKICYERKNMRISYSLVNGEHNRETCSFSGLIADLDGKNECRIVIKDNDREQLAFIVQQLIFIDYPLDKIDILLEEEEYVADKGKIPIKSIEEILEEFGKSYSYLQNAMLKAENIGHWRRRKRMINETVKKLEYLFEWKNTMLKLKSKNMTIAVAASKKTGKSVIVNCLLGERLAPASTEIATPNNCIFKKSSDNKYHLKFDGSEDIKSFKSSEELHEEIVKSFRIAQNNKGDDFSLPDMNIEYATDKKGFSSYTIYDTAGPDAAGTTHGIAALRAMEKCDVAIFAIDYSKYLTMSEEEYLKKIKDMFKSKNKFYSLIFVLNKIDVRYTDIKSPKSVISAVDFLKTRLANIDIEYKDCIIFPVSALEYFSAVEAERAGVTELISEVPISEMRNIKFAHRDVKPLTWLHTHSEDLNYYHGIDKISYDIFKKDSGMPALMSYVSYVMKNKARGEIANHIDQMNIYK
ncbi:MAG: dynamin family protein [Firmicutes bacterium]|nr:dynamin family protein [Bacillota bacterium]